MPTLLDSLLVQSEKRKLDTDLQLAQVKNERSRFNRMYDAYQSRVNEAKDNGKLVSERLKYEKKVEKLKEDFIEKLMTEGSGQTAVGDQLVSSMNVPVEENAGSFPILPVGQE